MRILLCSYAFAPGLGGIETVSKILAEQFTELGATVTVVTYTLGEPVEAPYEVLRRPSFVKLYELARHSEIAFQNNISLNMLPALFAARKPVVVAHHTWIRRTDGSRGWQDRLKILAVRGCHNIAISKAIAATLPVSSVIIGDPFEPGEFKDLGREYRTKDIVFMGRLVTDKGCDLALRALAMLKQEGICASFTVIGDGREAPKLKRLTEELGLSEQVTFLGATREGRGMEVARHKVMVIPSIWDEPFGVVALEGLAAGCVLAASSGGGLPDAVGPCGLLFPNGDVRAMAAALKELLTKRALGEKLMTERDRHLENFKPEVVAGKYMDVFESAMRSS